MKRAMFTVKTKGGTQYCANHLMAYDGQAGKQAMAFMSSGRLVTLPVEDVVAVELSDHWTHCNECDGPVSHLSYFLDEAAKAQA